MSIYHPASREFLTLDSVQQNSFGKSFRELPLVGKDKLLIHHFNRLFIGRRLLGFKKIRKIHQERQSCVGHGRILFKTEQEINFKHFCLNYFIFSVVKHVNHFLKINSCQSCKCKSWLPQCCDKKQRNIQLEGVLVLFLHFSLPLRNSTLEQAKLDKF